MAGHNKWSKVKRLKAVTDKEKGAVFATNKVPVPMGAAEIIEKLSEALGEQDDVQRVVHNGCQ